MAEFNRDRLCSGFTPVTLELCPGLAVTRTAREWAEHNGISWDTARQRRYRGHGWETVLAPDRLRGSKWHVRGYQLPLDFVHHHPYEVEVVPMSNLEIKATARMPELFLVGVSGRNLSDGAVLHLKKLIEKAISADGINVFRSEDLREMEQSEIDDARKELGGRFCLFAE